MKSYNHLFERMLDHDEIVAAIRETARGKTKRKRVQRTLEHIDEAADKIKEMLEAGWIPREHDRLKIKEGGHKKMRDNIQKPYWWPEQIIHHLIVRQLKPILVPRMARYTCGIVSKRDVNGPGRGALFACQTMVKWRNSYGNKRLYVLQADIRHFYNEIDIPTLETMLARRIRDKRFLELCHTVLSTAGPGLPKGFYTSPWFAQLYLEELDNYILQELKPDHYLRYMDNMYLLCTNKRKLRNMRDAIQKYLSTINLSLNERTQVFKFEKDGSGRAIDCVGFIIHQNRVTIRKNILKRIRAKVNRMHRHHRCTIHDARTMVSYFSWLTHTDTYNYYRMYIKPYVSKRYCRYTISRRSKHERLETGNGQLAG